MPTNPVHGDAGARLRQLMEWAARRRARVLVVDDSPTNRMVTSALLGKSGFTVDTASDGLEAVSAVARQALCFDAVLMDVAMPGMDGLDATRAIRALHLPHGAVPIIALTAQAFPEDRERCLAAGMNGWLSKPTRKVELLGVLADWIGDGDVR